MPVPAPPVTDERSALRTYLLQQQDAFRAVVFGLDHEALGRRHAPSELCLGGLLKHVTAAQRGWLRDALAAPELAPPVPEAESAYGSDFVWGPSDDPADALAAYEEVCADVLEAVERLPLDTPVPVPDVPWFPKDVAHWSVRWVWFHLIEELARHAGHADLIRESIDGATMYELIAGYEGWPETPWLKPWRPAA
ncbi:DinB family protein [Nocardioides limicola]|uniref:DinB family protein n=1 Tax=Nocardioides limicola TaxID=2803368 RepID=UPI00193BD1AB|nr:DinB family protein [Nocardioides sp. DJM-14]